MAKYEKSEIAINFSVYAYMSNNLQMESTTFRARIMNYNQLADKATMYFEWQTDFGRWVKISCITMSLFYSHSIYIFHVTLKNGYLSIQFH